MRAIDRRRRKSHPGSLRSAALSRGKIIGESYDRGEPRP
jgi:hypothetical protein